MNIIRKELSTILINSVCSQFVHTRTVAYKSAISLQNLYPQSTLKLTTPSRPIGSQNEKFDGFIPVDQLDITYSRSSGPGGQNVNKVNTKVDVRFNIQEAKWLSDEIKPKLLDKLKLKLTKDGYAIFRSDLTRSQQLNLADCLQKIRNCIRSCLIEKPETSPETQERIRRRIEKAAIERLAVKRERSEVKDARRNVDVQ